MNGILKVDCDAYEVVRLQAQTTAWRRQLNEPFLLHALAKATRQNRFFKPPSGLTSTCFFDLDPVY